MPARGCYRHPCWKDPGSADLDWDPPAAVLAALAERTGTGLAELRQMTIAGWVPWLLDSHDNDAGQEGFDTYVRQHSVLLFMIAGRRTESGATVLPARSHGPRPAGRGPCSRARISAAPLRSRAGAPRAVPAPSPAAG